MSERGELAGSVSGGCVEAAVVQEALDVLQRGTSRTVEFGVTAGRAWEVGLPCGGRIRVHVEPAPTARLRSIVAALAARQRVERVLELGGGEQYRVVLEPPVRLVIVGAVHLAQPLARMARVAGYDVTVVDPRVAFATGERFPDVTLERGWPAEVVPRLGLDARTALVALSHDRRFDDPALEAALRSDAFYVGALGSRKTQAALRERLRAAGFAEPVVERLHGPVGLDLGAVTPAEIAVEILAELVAASREAPAARRTVGAASS